MTDRPAALANVDPRLNGEVIFFDGLCALCNGIVDFVMRRDKARRYRYATLQSPLGQQVLQALALPGDRLETFILVENGRAYVKSTAALRILRNLPGLWPLLYAFILAPRSWRDAIYGYVGKRRYRWFGHRAVCRTPSPKERGLFL